MFSLSSYEVEIKTGRQWKYQGISGQSQLVRAPYAYRAYQCCRQCRIESVLANTFSYPGGMWWNGTSLAGRLVNNGVRDEMIHKKVS
jgi:hypothetical protein